jgi:hypothetical protein
MRMFSHVVSVIVGVLLVIAAATGCTTTAGTPVADTTSGPAGPQATTPAQTMPSAGATPTPEPVGTAIMKVTGGSAPVTIHYQINGGSEETETGVSLPWEKQYPVYEELESQVAADGGDTVLTCTIIMDADKLVSFKTEPRPVCNFAYWG